jgi:hypothetical protein
MPPKNVHQKFLGSANFFLLTFGIWPLNVLTRKVIGKGGPSPSALYTFNEVGSALCSEPIVNYLIPSSLTLPRAMTKTREAVEQSSAYLTTNGRCMILPRQAPFSQNMNKIILHF